jgi:mRNA interferase MazF
MKLKIDYGEIWIVDLGEKNGTELGKKRPVLVFQSQILLNSLHPSTIIIPLTTKLIDNAEPLRIRIKAMDLLKEDSDILIDQVQSIDNSRFVEGPITRCDKALMDKIYDAVMQVIGR